MKPNGWSSEIPPAPEVGIIAGWYSTRFTTSMTTSDLAVDKELRMLTADVVV